MSDVQQDGFLSVLSVRSVPKTSSPDDDVYPQVPACSERFAALHVVWDSEPLQYAGDRIEKWLALVHLRLGSGSDACAPGVNVHCIAAGASHCHVLLIPIRRHPMPTNSAPGTTRNESAGLARRNAVASAPCRLLERALAKALVSPPPSGSSGPGGCAVSAAVPARLCGQHALPG